MCVLIVFVEGCFGVGFRASSDEDIVLAEGSNANDCSKLCKDDKICKYWNWLPPKLCNKLSSVSSYITSSDARTGSENCTCKFKNKFFIYNLKGVFIYSKV